MTSTSHTRSGHFGLALMLAALATLGPFSIDTFLPAMPAIGASLGASQVAMQQALTVYLFCYGLMMLWHGAISDALGRKPVIVASTLVFTLASVGCALAQTLPQLLIFRALQGLSGGAGLIVGRAVIRDRLEREYEGEVTIITQNIDLLHSRSGSRTVYELHGHLRELVCPACHCITPAADALEPSLER